MSFWPAIRENLTGGDQLADTAIAQEQEGKEVLDDYEEKGSCASASAACEANAAG